MPSLRLPGVPSHIDSDSDSDSPEAVSLSHSKKSIQQQNAHVRKAEALARQKTKLRNREKDQKLKARSARNKDDKISSKKGKGKQVSMEVEDGDEVEGGVVDEVEARMLRAMMDAEGEEDEGRLDDDDEGEFSEFQEGSSFDGIDMGSGEESAECSDEDEVGSDEDEDMESYQRNEEEEGMVSDEDAEPTSQPEKPKKSSNYLPDELFKAAFTQATKPQASQPKKDTHTKKQQKKRKRAPTQKDVIIGSKAIRTLASTTRPISSKAAVPSSKINKFLNRSLALKGQRPIPGKGWERRPANIGVLRRNGPAAHFVRSR